MDVGRCELAPVGTGSSPDQGAASTKEVPAGEGGGEVRLGRCNANEFNSHRLGRFTTWRETRAVSGRTSWHSRGGSCP